MALSTKAAHRKDRNIGTVELQHRHFAYIAATIRKLHGSMNANDVALVAEHFADELADTNENFKHDRFLAACAE